MAGQTLNEQLSLDRRVGKLESAWQYSKGFGACLSLLVAAVGAHLVGLYH
jgi:hypothetical protein